MDRLEILDYLTRTEDETEIDPTEAHLFFAYPQRSSLSMMRNGITEEDDFHVAQQTLIAVVELTAPSACAFVLPVALEPMGSQVETTASRHLGRLYLSMDKDGEEFRVYHRKAGMWQRYVGDEQRMRYEGPWRWITEVYKRPSKSEPIRRRVIELLSAKGLLPIH